MLYRQFATQEEIDKEYDVEKSVPDIQRYAEFNMNESKKARNELECRLDVPFGPTVEETFDIFPAQDPGDRRPKSAKARSRGKLGGGWAASAMGI